MGRFQHYRGLVELLHAAVGDDAVLLYVAEEGDLFPDRLLHRAVGAKDDEVRGDAGALELLDGVLGGFGLNLPGAGDVEQRGHMEKDTVSGAHLGGHLADGLQKGLAFDVPHGASHLGDDHIGPGGPAHGVEEGFDLVGDVGDHLDGAAQVVPSALLVQKGPVDLAGGEIAEPVEVFVDEPFVVPQIQVGLRPVLGDKDLPVLVGTHGAGVNVQIGVQLLGGHFISPVFQQTAEAGGGNPFAQAGDHPTGDKHIFCFHLNHPLPFLRTACAQSGLFL